MQTNCCAEKLTAAHAWFTSHGMLNIPTWQPHIPHPIPSDTDEDQSGDAEEGAIYNEVFLPQTHSTPIVVLFPNKTICLNDSSKLSTQPSWAQSEDWPPKSP